MSFFSKESLELMIMKTDILLQRLTKTSIWWGLKVLKMVECILPL